MQSNIGFLLSSPMTSDDVIIQIVAEDYRQAINALVSKPVNENSKENKIQKKFKKWKTLLFWTFPFLEIIFTCGSFFFFFWLASSSDAESFGCSSCCFSCFSSASCCYCYYNSNNTKQYSIFSSDTSFLIWSFILYWIDSAEIPLPLSDSEHEETRGKKNYYQKRKFPHISPILVIPFLNDL